MIDPQTGIISFEQPLVQFGPALTRTEFLSAPWAIEAADFIVNEPWHSWKLGGPHLSGSVPFVIVLFFHGEDLKMVDFAHSDPKFGTSWDDYSVEKEMNRKASHDQWLSACIGLQRAFPWGSVWSGYDERGGGSSIFVRYEPGNGA